MLNTLEFVHKPSSWSKYGINGKIEHHIRVVIRFLHLFSFIFYNLIFYIYKVVFNNLYL